jgi:hypothetical protein
VRPRSAPPQTHIRVTSPIIDSFICSRNFVEPYDVVQVALKEFVHGFLEICAAVPIRDEP